MALGVGENAPDFDLSDKEGARHRLSELGDQYKIIYFYPKDDTPGCTIEAKEFTAAQSRFEQLGARVIGISGGDDESKRKFCDKHQIGILLLSDPDFSVAKSFEVYGEKSFMGRTFDGIHRTTFVVDADGTIVKVFENVRAEGHAQEVIDFLSGGAESDDAAENEITPLEGEIEAEDDIEVNEFPTIAAAVPAQAPAAPPSAGSGAKRSAGKSARKSGGKARAAKKTAPKKSAVKKAAAKTTGKSTAKKAAKRSAPKKSAKKAPAARATKKGTARKVGVKRNAPAARKGMKKASAKKAAPKNAARKRGKAKKR